MDTCLTIFGVLLALALGGTFVSLIYKHYFSKKDALCLTEGCIHSASKMLEMMDRSVKPCDDFYQFACGGFIKNTDIPDDQSSVSAFSLIEDQLQEQLKTVVEEPVKPDEPKPFRLVKNLYNICMNHTAIEEDGLTTIKTVLKSSGGWPVLEGKSWNDKSFDWKQSVYNLTKIGYSAGYLIDFSVGSDSKNSAKRIIFLDQANFGLAREFLIEGLENKLVKAYYDYMVDIAVIFGANINTAKEDLGDALRFEMKLAKISLPKEQRRNATALYNPMTVEKLQERYPSIPWVQYINTIMSAGKLKVESDETVIVPVPDYIKNLEEILKTTSTRIQANYIMWRAVASTVSFLNEKIKKRQLQYHTVVNGITALQSRWKECLDVASANFRLAAGALYVRKYFKEEAKKNALEMVGDINSEFKEILGKVDWMDDATRKNALEKAAAMTNHIGYPVELLDDKKLEEFYQNLDIAADDHYLKSILNINLFWAQYEYGQFRKPVNKTDWISHGIPAVVNAFYSSIENSIQFPAGILQGVFFDNDRPRYMNYGAIGFVIGHEITHGFDDQGRQFDKDGNLMEWWDPKTKEAYLKKAQCIIEQYENCTVPELDLHLNGINTQGENIADNGGIKEAYLAYSKWVTRNGEEPRLPGLDYTPNQMFWISAASVWCTKMRPEQLKQRIITNEHSPSMFRVLIPFRNMEAFSQDFGCPVNSGMNPSHKCNVW